MPKAVEEFMYPAMEDFRDRHHARRGPQRPHREHEPVEPVHDDRRDDADAAC